MHIVDDDFLRAFYRLFYLQFCHSSDRWKNTVWQLLLAIWEIFFHENNRNYNSCRFSYKFPFILFLSFLTNQKQESGFQQAGGRITRNISDFCLKRVALYFKAMNNLIQQTFTKEFLTCYCCSYYSSMD